MKRSWKTHYSHNDCPECDGKLHSESTDGDHFNIGALVDCESCKKIVGRIHNVSDSAICRFYWWRMVLGGGFKKLPKKSKMVDNEKYWGIDD